MAKGTAAKQLRGKTQALNTDEYATGDAEMHPHFLV
jgi:hypothetical protein